MEQIIHQLDNSGNVLVVSHEGPDGDAVGSLIAMGLALDALHKEVTLFNESAIPAVYRFLPSVNRIKRMTGEISRFDTAVILDCGDLKRIGKTADLLDRKKGIDAPFIINIDHHITNTYFGDFQLIDTGACATCEIVYRLMKEMNVPLNKNIATSIYTGILTDTGSFRFSNTNRAAFEICNEMVALGVEPYNVAKHVYGRYSLERIKLLNLALDSIEISENGKLSLMTITRRMFNETGTNSEDVDGLINYARLIADVKVAVLIQENHIRSGNGDGNKQYHISLRSDGSVDVAAIAFEFGGGGHRSAAGFNIDGRISDLKTGMLDLAERI